MEIGHGIDHVSIPEIAFQFLDKPCLFGDVAHDVKLVVLGL